ncbi:MAG: type II/IV secretion system protein [Sedimentisphaerales bacterium]|nr:type II/IV secretion system protein [Sedimentisphaerales bacterium]
MDNPTCTISYIREHGLLDEATLEKVAEQHRASGRSFVSLLKEGEYLPEEQLGRLVAASQGIEFIDLSADMIDPMAAHMVTHEMASRHNVIPVRKEGDKLLVAMSTPLNLAVRNQIEVRTGLKVVPLATTLNAITQAVRYHFSVQNVTRQAIASMRLKADDHKEETDSGTLRGKLLQNAEGPITKLVSSIIIGAIDVGASDIHIEPQEPDMRVRYRIDGLLHNEIGVPSSVQQEVISHIKILANMDISERRISQDGHMTLGHNGRDYDLRISSLPSVKGEKIVIRVLDKGSSKWLLDELAASADDSRRLRSLVQSPYGIILLTGPTGSGKTTTLYSMLQFLNEPKVNIVTVEDPVEYHLDGITQVQVNKAAGRTFASALRSILRQDPDIILIGEIRDYETAEIAVSAALTGHLVLSTLHTNDAAGAVSRLINLGIPPFLVASSLLGVVAQRLVRTTCIGCRQAYSPTEQELEQLSCIRRTDEAAQLYRGTGCDNCHGTGYRGRKAIFEVLSVSRAIRESIINGDGDDHIKQQAISEGMKTLRKTGIEQALNGSTTIDELQRLVDMRAE